MNNFEHVNLSFNELSKINYNILTQMGIFFPRRVKWIQDKEFDIQLLKYPKTIG